MCYVLLLCFFFEAEYGIRDLVRSRGLGDVYKRQVHADFLAVIEMKWVEGNEQRGDEGRAGDGRACLGKQTAGRDIDQGDGRQAGKNGEET